MGDFMTISILLRLQIAAMLALSTWLVPAAAAESILYGYDALGRIVRVEYVGGVNNGLIIHYSYDAAGNRLQVEVED